MQPPSRTAAANRDLREAPTARRAPISVARESARAVEAREDREHGDGQHAGGDAEQQVHESGDRRAANDGGAFGKGTPDDPIVGRGQRRKGDARQEVSAVRRHQRRHGQRCGEAECAGRDQEDGGAPISTQGPERRGDAVPQPRGLRLPTGAHPVHCPSVRQGVCRNMGVIRARSDPPGHDRLDPRPKRRPADGCALRRRAGGALEHEARAPDDCRREIGSPTSRERSEGYRQRFILRQARNTLGAASTAHPPCGLQCTT